MIDRNEYTLHFLPILNPEGTIIVTSAIRSLIKRDSSDLDEQLFCIQYYMNSKLEDNLAIEKNDYDIKTQNWMFRYADANCIDYNHSDLRDNVDKIIKKHQLPKGVLISWNSNGNGIDLNANIECGEYIDKFIANEEMPASLRQNTILKNLPGPTGCPSKKVPIEIEPENIATLNFYNELIEKEKVIGSIIYHSCGGIVYYLDELKENNPWVKDYGNKEFSFNKSVALKYAEISKYKVEYHKRITTMDAKLKSYLPGTLLVELSKIRANPLSQFIDMPNQMYTETILDNLRAIKPTIEEMKKQYNLYKKSNQ